MFSYILVTTDFKTITGIEARRFKSVATHTLSPHQLVAGSDRRVHPGIARARDAIFAASKKKEGCGILDTDYIAAFDWMVMHWVFMVLAKKGLSQQVINRLKNLYMENLSVIVVNNDLGRVIQNERLSVRQGDVPSMTWFAYGIDPLLHYLNKRLKGIPIFSLPVLGPVQENAAPLPPLEDKYKVIGYADDMKPAITNMEEFQLVDHASALFERSSGCKLHRDPTAGKCKFLPLGKWRTSLTQDDIPSFMLLSDHLDMVGVELRATYTQTRKINGDIVQDRVQKIKGAWRSGKFMPLTQRPWSINTYCLSKVWCKSNVIDLRVADITSINSKIKSWLYSDQFEKPEEMVLFRPTFMGGLNLHNVKYKSMAMLIRSFLETAANPNYIHSLFHRALFNHHVLLDHSWPDPGTPPYFSQEFFSTIRNAFLNSPLDITLMTSSQWYHHLLQEHVTMAPPAENTPASYIPCRTETNNPDTDWERTWRLARLKGLDSDQTTFLWRLLHRLLPTLDRVNRLNPNTSPICRLCDDHLVEDLQHAFISCPFNREISVSLMNIISLSQPIPNMSRVLTLNFEMEDQMEFPLVWLTSNFLRKIWDLRKEKKRCDLFRVRADLEAKVSLLRESRFSESAIIISQLLSNI